MEVQAASAGLCPDFVQCPCPHGPGRSHVSCGITHFPVVSSCLGKASAVVTLDCDGVEPHNTSAPSPSQLPFQRWNPRDPGEGFAGRWVGGKGPAPGRCLSSWEQNVSCPWSPKYSLAPSAPGASPASLHNPHRAQPRRGCQPTAVPPGHCCGTDTVIRVHTRHCSFRALSAAFAARFYPNMQLCTQPVHPGGHLWVPGVPGAIPPAAGSQRPSASPSKVSSVLAGTEEKLGRGGAPCPLLLCSR